MGRAIAGIGGGMRAAEPKHEYTGKLHKGKQEGTVRGWLIDVLGCRIEFDGTRDPRGNGYLIVGKVVSMPEYLKQPVDNE